MTISLFYQKVKSAQSDRRDGHSFGSGPASIGSLVARPTHALRDYCPLVALMAYVPFAILAGKLDWTSTYLAEKSLRLPPLPLGDAEIPPSLLLGHHSLAIRRTND